MAATGLAAAAAPRAAVLGGPGAPPFFAPCTLGVAKDTGGKLAEPAPPACDLTLLLLAAEPKSGAEGFDAAAAAAVAVVEGEAPPPTAPIDATPVEKGLGAAVAAAAAPDTENAPGGFCSFPRLSVPPNPTPAPAPPPPPPFPALPSPPLPFPTAPLDRPRSAPASNTDGCRLMKPPPETEPGVEGEAAPADDTAFLLISREGGRE